MKKILFIAACLLAAFVVLGQEGDSIIIPPPIGPEGQLQDFLDLYAMLEGAIIVILGYLHNWIPGLNMISSKWFRVIIIGLVVAVVFVALGWQSGFGTALVFLQAVGFYEIILKKVKPSPPVAEKSKA